MQLDDILIQGTTVPRLATGYLTDEMGSLSLRLKEILDGEAKGHLTNGKSLLM